MRDRRMRRWVACLAALAWLAAAGVAAEAPGAGRAGAAARVFNVRDHGATGDGATLDTAAFDRAIEACRAAGGGQVLVPPGRYLAGTVRLQSRMTILLEAGATIVGTPDLTQYRNPTPPDFMPEARWGKWHRALVLGENVEDVTIAGLGTIDGNKVFDPTGEERMRGPHTIVLANSRRVTIRDIAIADSANYAIFFLVSDQVDIRDVTFAGGWDGVHFRGVPQRYCRDVSIIGCRFSTGDDSIAGSYWESTVISGCVVNSSCNGVRLIGPAKRLIIHDCLFYGPGVHPHRTSERHNMLSGIILQPGAWEPMPGPLDDVLISNVTMRDVASPVTVWLKPGNTGGRITVSRLSATGVYRAAASVESWAPDPLGAIIFRDVDIECTGGGTAAQAEQPVKGPGVDSRPLPAWGFYARNVDRVAFEDVRLSYAADDLRQVLQAEQVKRLSLDCFRFTRVEGVAKPAVLNGVGQVVLRETGLPKQE